MRKDEFLHAAAIELIRPVMTQTYLDMSKVITEEKDRLIGKYRKPKQWDPEKDQENEQAEQAENKEILKELQPFVQQIVATNLNGCLNTIFQLSHDLAGRFFEGVEYPKHWREIRDKQIADIRDKQIAETEVAQQMVPVPESEVEPGIIRIPDMKKGTFKKVYGPQTQDANVDPISEEDLERNLAELARDAREASIVESVSNSIKKIQAEADLRQEKEATSDLPEIEGELS